MLVRKLLRFRNLGNGLLLLLLAFYFSGWTRLNPTTEIIGYAGDNYSFLSMMFFTKENLLSMRHPFADTNFVRFPYGFPYSFGFDGAFPIIYGALLSLVFGPILAYNLVVLSIVFLNISITYIYMYKLGKLFGNSTNLHFLALVAAIIFGLSPYVLARLSAHLNLLCVFGYPALVYYVVVTIRNQLSGQKPTYKDLVPILISLFIIQLSSLQYFVLTLFLILFLLGFWLVILRKRLELLNSWRTLFLTSQTVMQLCVYGLGYLLISMLVFANFYSSVLFSQLLVRPLVDRLFYSANVVDLFITNSYLGGFLSILNTGVSEIEHVAVIGYLEMGLLFYLIIKTRHRILALLAASILVFIVLVCLAVLPLPFVYEGSRAVMLTSLLAAVLVVLSDFKFTKLTLVVIIGLLIIERYTFLFYKSDFLPIYLYDQIKQLPGNAILEIPLSTYEPFRNTIPVFTQKRIFDGYISHTAEIKSARYLYTDPLLYYLSCPTSPSKFVLDFDYGTLRLREMGMRQILIYKKRVSAPACSGKVDAYLSFLNQQILAGDLKLVMDTNEYILYVYSAL